MEKQRQDQGLWVERGVKVAWEVTDTDLCKVWFPGFQGKRQVMGIGDCGLQKSQAPTI